VLPDPLHPAVVHFPIAIAVLLPFALALAAGAILERALGEALERPIHEQEENAERLVLGFGASFALTAAGLLRGGRSSSARHGRGARHPARPRPAGEAPPTP